MTTHERDGVQYLTFPHFAQTGLCLHGFSTRVGGVSEGCYASLNLRLGRGDDRARVMENFRRFCGAVGVSVSDLVLSRQVHGTRIYAAGREDIGKGILRESDIGEADGLSTDTPGVALVTFYADCVPLYFLDVQKKAIGLAHAGWKGTLANMAAAMIAHMRARYGSRAEDLLAGIGPAIGACCFEVDQPVADRFRNGLRYADKYIAQGAGGKLLIDLQGLNKLGMIEAGVLSENIAQANECTKCRPEKYFSHRLTGDARGGMAAVLMLR